MSLKSLHLLIESFLWWLMPFGGIYWIMFPLLFSNSALVISFTARTRVSASPRGITRTSGIIYYRIDSCCSLIRSGAALPFTGHASPPTITMPRVKAITTGSVPSFLDVVLNFAESDTSSTLATQDSWLAQMKAKQGSRLVMYGDDTWLKLFPGFFDRADGTTSFFVSVRFDINVNSRIF
jgi:predicted AlkP superfamily pyrophosphatase or phosphodiesterase